MKFVRETLFLCLVAVGPRGGEADDQFWPEWRGPRMDGISADGNPPLEWSEQKNVAWKVALAGRGSSTPVIWGERLYLLTAVPADGSSPRLPPHADPAAPGGPKSARGPVEQSFELLAIDRADGHTVWARTATRGTPSETTQENNSYASASAITDGEVLIAFFGSWGLYTYDMEGHLKWSRDFGEMHTRNGFGEGATPTLHGDTVVVPWDHEEQSFIVALDKTTGEELWRRNRDEVTTWATPLVVDTEGRSQVVTAGTNHVTSYDLATGEILWQGPGLTLNAIPSPVARDGVVYATSGFLKSVALAVRLSDARGDIRGTSALLWTIERNTPYVPSPLVYGDILYLVKSNNGIITALDAETGNALFGPVRLPGIYEIYASPVGVAGRVYIVGRDGNAVVLRNAPELEVLAESSLDDGFDASPALVGREMYLRGYHYLYRISEN